MANVGTVAEHLASEARRQISGLFSAAAEIGAPLGTSARLVEGYCS
jgi:hypothetical protein